MATFEYTQDGSCPLSGIDIYKLFNNYRLCKYIMAILVNLNKTELSEYKILEPGCGGGEKLRFFTELRAKPGNCYGFDISEKAINLCKSLSPNTMNFQVGSVFDMSFGNNTFDIIICSGFLDCFNDDNDIKRISKILNEVIKDDGILFVIDINENFVMNEVALERRLRSFNSKKGELEQLLSGEFNSFHKMYIFGAEIYKKNDGTLAQILDLPTLDNLMDLQDSSCAYSLWTFLKNK